MRVYEVSGVSQNFQPNFSTFYQGVLWAAIDSNVRGIQIIRKNIETQWVSRNFAG